MKYKYYRLTEILKKKADYNLIYGERGNGKTYAVQEYMLNERLKNGNQCMILRRWAEDVTPKNAAFFWDGVLIDKLKEMSKGEYSTIHYNAGVYYLGNWDKNHKPTYHPDTDILGYVWGVSESQRMRGHSYPKVTNILFDEFISMTERGYVPGEVSLFLNEVVTVARTRTNVKVWLLGNTINPYNPYFDFFKIDPLKIKQGEIYTYDDPVYGGKLAVEYCASHPENHKKGSAIKYVGFGDAYDRQMIAGGQWQLPFYPTCDPPETPPEWTGYIEYKGHWLRFDVINETEENKLWAYVSTVTEPEIGDCPIFTLKPSQYLISYIKMSRVDGQPILKENLLRIFENKKIWYDSRMSGCWLDNYIVECGDMWGNPGL